MPRASDYRVVVNLDGEGGQPTIDDEEDTQIVDEFARTARLCAITSDEYSGDVTPLPPPTRLDDALIAAEQLVTRGELGRAASLVLEAIAALDADTQAELPPSTTTRLCGVLQAHLGRVSAIPILVRAGQIRPTGPARDAITRMVDGQATVAHVAQMAGVPQLEIYCELCALLAEGSLVLLGR